ncbi:MAG: SemiSWEET family transporter [Gammaproteobacteria bacterium]
MTESIGWVSSIVLLLTIGRQVYTQWRTRSTSGLSRWLFVGQVTASLGFTTYSFLLKNWVFVFTNAVLLVTAVIGQFIYLRNLHRESSGDSSVAERTR